MAHITLYWRGTTGRVGGGAEAEVLLQARTKSHHAGGTNNMCWGLPFGTMKEQQEQLRALPSSTPDAAAAPPQTVPGLASLRIAAREVDADCFSPTGPTTDRTRNRLCLDASREKSCHIWASLRAVVAAAAADSPIGLEVTTSKRNDTKVPLDAALVSLFRDTDFLESELGLPAVAAAAPMASTASTASRPTVAAVAASDPSSPTIVIGKERLLCHAVFTRQAGDCSEVLVVRRETPREVGGGATCWDLPAGVFERPLIDTATTTSAGALIETVIHGCAADLGKLPSRVVDGMRARDGDGSSFRPGKNGADGAPFATQFFVNALDDHFFKIDMF